MHWVATVCLCPIYETLDVLVNLKVQITSAADGNLEYFFHCFSEKMRLDISCESSAGQRIHMKHQALLSVKAKSRKKISVVCCSFAWLFMGNCGSIV